MGNQAPQTAPPEGAEQPIVGQAPMNATELAAVLGDRLGTAPIVSASEAARDEKAEEAANHVRMVDEAFDAIDASVTAMLDGVDTPEARKERLATIRKASIDADSEAEMSGAEYADLLGRVFDPMWPTWKKGDETLPANANLAPVMVAFFAEKADYYDDYRKLRARFSKRPNPRVGWSRFEVYQIEALRRAQAEKLRQDAIARGEDPAPIAQDTGAKRKELTALQALARDVPKLYLRVQREIPLAGNERLENLGRELHLICKDVLSDSELQALAEKVPAPKA